MLMLMLQWWFWMYQRATVFGSLAETLLLLSCMHA
jgi:hypothetical protein